jgi:dihydroxyacid dehydratase/phosphogluconate dehydratase
MVNGAAVALLQFGWFDKRTMDDPSLQGAYAVGKITEEQRFDVVRHACPGPGACGGMYTYVRPSSVRFGVGRDLTGSTIRRPTAPIP